MAPSLSDVLASRGSLPLSKWRPWLDLLLDALEHVHGHDYLHRDITPRNILIRAHDGQPVLIDFGAARIAAGERTRTVVLTEAYAPLEQHSARAKQGPFTDIYAMAAVSYHVLTGEPPPTAPARAIADDCVPLAQRLPDLSEQWRDWFAAVDRALALMPEDRPQTVAAWRRELNEASAKMWLRGEPAATRDAEGLTALHRAAAGEPLPAVVAFLLDCGADIHASAGTGDDDLFASGETPLHRAAAANPNPGVTALLLDRGADVHSKNGFDATPLHLAAWENANAAVANVLLDRGASAKSRDLAGMTPLHRAVQANACDAVEVLLRRGSSVRDAVSDPFRITPLLRLASTNHEDTSACVGTTPLHIAAAENAIEVTSQLLDHGADTNARDESGLTPLHHAAQRNALGTLELLLGAGSDPLGVDLAGRMPIHIAAAANAPDTVRRLLQAGTPVQSNVERSTKFWKWETSVSASSIVRALGTGKGHLRDRGFHHFRLVPAWSDVRPVAEMLLHRSNTPLHWAAFGDSQDVAKLLLDTGADAHGGSAEGPTPLDLAALGNATNTARLLLDCGAEPRGRDRSPATPLHWAALGNSCETLGLLIDRGANPAACPAQWTPLFFAALGNARKAMELLLANGATIGPHNTSGSIIDKWSDWREAREGFPALDAESRTDTLLHWAAVRDADDVVEFLLALGLDLESEDGTGRTPLDYAAQGDAVRGARRLLDKGANIAGSQSVDETPLHSAARAGATGTARLLLERGAKVQAGRSGIGTPLHMAQSAELASLLLDSGAEVDVLDSDGRTPLHRADDSEVARLLVHRGSDVEAVDNDGNRPLHNAVLRDVRDVAELLLKQGATPDATNRNENTPLHLAASVSGDYNAKPLVVCLLRKGADVSVVNAEGKTPLVVAITSGAPKSVVECLLEHGADLNSSDRHGSSPLHLAARYEFQEAGREVIALLLGRGADVDVQDERGRTPLHITADVIDSTGDPEPLWLAQLLIDHNANIHVRDRAGRTALEALQRSVAAIDGPDSYGEAVAYSQAVESFRVHPRSSMQQLLSGK